MSFDFKAPLANPSDACVDIIFVHGVRGDPVKTWSDCGVFWPKDLLPETLPTARIFSWGYDAKIISFWAPTTASTERTMLDHAKSLLADLAGVRNDTPSRPIILVAHSLGGIVCAKAILHAQSLDDHLGKTGKQIRGILFLGTPLRGSDKAKWAERGRVFLEYFKESDANILTHLQERSTMLVELSEQFSNISHTKKGKDDEIKVVCFYEEKQSQLGIRYGKIVEKESAILDGFLSLPLPGDHSAMCKFDSTEAYGYGKVTDVLKAWIKEILEPREGRSSRGGVYQAGSTFGDNLGGFQLGNAYSSGSSPVVSGMQFYYSGN